MSPPLCRLRIVWLVVPLGVSAVGCVQRLGDFTAISTKNVPLEYEQGAVVKGEDCRMAILGIPLGFPNLEEAVEDAVGSRGNALVNQVTYRSWWDAILVGQQCIEVKGEAVTIR